MSPISSDLTSLVSLALFPLRWLYEFFTEGPADTLLFLACLIGYAGRRLRSDDAGVAAVWHRRVGLTALLAVGIGGYHTAEQRSTPGDHAFGIAMRAVFAMIITQGASTLAVPFLGWTWRLMSLGNWSLSGRLHRARREYHAACRSLRNAGLDDEELRAALAFARQKYLRQLHGSMSDEESEHP